MKLLNIFYEEPNPDRWLQFDRYPRALIRRIYRGPETVGGVKRWFLNLIHGLDLIGQPYMINDYKLLKKDPTKWALVIGRSQVIEKIPKYTKIIYGPAISSHPSEDNFWKSNPQIKHILISCNWLKQMYDRDLPYYIPSTIWPSGVDTNLWKPEHNKLFKGSVLIYDKIRWERDYYTKLLLQPIYKKLEKESIHFKYIKYGTYNENHFRNLLKEADAMIFLCEHETQGFAYLQTLSCNIPILAWDRGGFWKDPHYYPSRVSFEQVSAVPYWHEQCGEKFKEFEDFSNVFEHFWNKVKASYYAPREFILTNFKLEYRAKQYLDIISKIISDSDNRI